MEFAISKIHLSIEKIGLEEIDYSNENTDVIVEMLDGNTYTATFITFKNLTTLNQQSRIDGTFLVGKYFWIESMVIVEDCTLLTVEQVLHDLIYEGDFENVFRKL